MLMKYLTIIFLLLTQLPVFFCYGGAFTLSQSFPSQENSLQHYVSPAQIRICEDGIIIELETICLLVQNIFYDENGFYYLKDGIRIVCPKCGAFNDLDNKECYRCHTRLQFTPVNYTTKPSIDSFVCQML